jgi:hypothetical protein
MTDINWNMATHLRSQKECNYVDLDEPAIYMLRYHLPSKAARLVPLDTMVVSKEKECVTMSLIHPHHRRHTRFVYVRLHQR